VCNDIVINIQLNYRKMLYFHWMPSRLHGVHQAICMDGAIYMGYVIIQ